MSARAGAREDAEMGDSGRWVCWSDDDGEHIVHEGLSANQTDAAVGMELYLGDAPNRSEPGMDVSGQTQRLIDWLNHIAPDGIIPPAPDADSTT